MSSLVLVVDHDAALLARIAGEMADSGHITLTVPGAADGLRLLGGQPPLLTLCPDDAEAELRAALPEKVPLYPMTQEFRALAGEPAIAGAPSAIAACLEPVIAQDRRPPPASGTLTGVTLPDLLFTLHRQRRSGTLALQWTASGEARRLALEFARGEITALAAAHETGPVEDALAQAAAAEDGRFTLTDDVRPAAPPLGPLIPLAAQLARRLCEPLLAGLFEGGRVVPAPHPLPLRPLRQCPLTPAEGYLFSQVNGRSPLDTLAASGVLSKRDCQRALFTLFNLRLVSVWIEGQELIYGDQGEFQLARQTLLSAAHSAGERIEAFAARLHGHRPRAILGLSNQATEEEVRARHAALVEEFQPAKYSPEIRERHRNKLSLIQTALGDVLLTLLTKTAVKTAEETGATQEFRQQEAAQLREKAVAYIKDEDYTHAHNVLNLSLQYEPDRAETHHLLAIVQLKNPDPVWQRQAEENLLKALELDPANGEYSVTLARYYLDRAMPLKARRVIEPAQKRHPGHAGVILIADELKRRTN